MMPAMASLSIQRLSTTLRHVRRPLKLQLTRGYAVAPAKPAWIPRQYAKPISSTAPKAQASTGTGIGNPEIIESLPNTASELKVTSEIPPPNGNVSESTTSGNGGETPTDWSKSYHGLSTQAFSKDIAEILLAPIDPLDIEMKPGEYSISSHTQF